MKLTKKTLSAYYPNVSIRKAINEHLTKFKGKLLDIGCGNSPYKEIFLSNSNVTHYLGLDLKDGHYDNKPDYTWDGKKIPFANESIDTIIITEVFEHLPDIDTVLKECNPVLKKGGILFFTVPFIWPTHDIPFDEYRYTPYSLKRHFENSNFKNIEIYARGGWDASLATILGLWVNLRPLGTYKRNLIKIIITPVIKYLFKKDLPPKDFNKGHLMFPGLYGVIYK